MHRSVPRFFWIALATGLGFLTLFVPLAARAMRDAGTVRDDGWRAGRAGGVWRVDSVDADGPAAGSLQRGDRILAVDGDARAARIGPNWQLQDLPIGQPYALTVERSGRAMPVALRAASRADPTFGRWVLVYLAIALTFYGVGMTVALVKPEDPMVQYAFANGLLVAAFMLWESLKPQSGVHVDNAVRALGLVFPLYLITSYLFLERFPRVFTAAPRWRVIRHAIVAAGLFTWMIRNLVTLIWMTHPRAHLGAIDRGNDAIVALQTISAITDTMFLVGAALAILAVLWRNYRLVPNGNDRRRIRLLAWSNVLTISAILIVAILTGVAGAVGAGPDVLAAMTTAKQVGNVLTVSVPLALGYAIIKHRVLGFRLAVRLGIQYVLAKNVLRIALALPLAWIAYTAITRPDQTIGQVLFNGYGKINLLGAGVALLGLRFGAPFSRALDRRFFREAYDQEAILRRLVEDVKAADTIIDIGTLASREIDAALHVGKVFIFHHDTRGHTSSAPDASTTDGFWPRFAEDSALAAELERAAAARTVDELRTHCSDVELEWLDQTGIELCVPITNSNRRLVGALFVGAKKSEEPFTSKDRGLLQLVAAQIGAAYEVLTLREQVDRQEQVQRDVLARLEEKQIALVQECPTCGTCYDSGVERCAMDGDRLTMSLPVERVLDGKYRLDRLLGRGGMGAVYAALDLRLQRPVAVKVIKASEIGSTAAHRRFAREAQACARLDHPRIVRVYDYGLLANQSGYLVMERIDGESWRRWIDRLGAFTPTSAAELLDQVCDGMTSAHTAGILHRDLKPDNLLVTFTSDGVPQVKILDFGLAKVREVAFEDPKSRTMAGMVMGTFGYMSPEQFAGQEVDERTDVYSLGVIALETLTGKFTFKGRNFHEMIEVELAARLAIAAQSTTQATLVRVLRRSLAIDKAERVASVNELRRTLVPAIRACHDLRVPGPVGAPTASGVSAAIPPHAPFETPTQASGPKMKMET